MDESQTSSLIQKQQAMLQQQMSKLQQEQLSSLFQQQQSAISRFPSNIDAHLGFRHSLNHPNPNPNPNNNNNNNNHILNNNSNSNNNSSIPLLQQQLLQQQKKVQGMRTTTAAGGASQPEVQLAYQDAWKVCHPDFTRPFSSLQDACERLLPYHVVADYEAEEDDRILESDTTGQILSRSQQWDNNIAAKVAEFTATFEKQALAFNIISRKRSLGEFRSEERLMIEQALLQEEKQAVYEVKTELESREKAGREAQLRMAAAMVQTRGDAQRGPLRGSAVGSQGSDHEMMSEREHHGAEEMMNGWGNNMGREDREPSEDFLNDEETDNGETSGQHEWREVGEFDLNTR